MPGSKDEIKSFIVRTVAGADPGGWYRTPLAGFSSADDPLFEEIIRIVGDHHLRPRDVWPGVRTVLSFFIPFSGTLVRGNRGRGPVSRDWGLSYVRTNALIGRLGRDLIQMAGARGHPAAAIPATHNFDSDTLRSAWSHRSAALVAGLGRFGLNNMLIGPSGCAGRYGTVFLSSRLEPDPRPEEEFCLYFKSGQCRACLAACPVGALGAEGFDRFKCYARLKENSAGLNIEGRQVDVCGKCVVSGPCALKSA
ncbi:MAG: epoxyqueuosine reductase [Candidatus Adiutrix sp.]|nr:epoxyqueuosine reductase [Candidatus Adiutrix sp.]